MRNPSLTSLLGTQVESPCPTPTPSVCLIAPDQSPDIPPCPPYFLPAYVSYLSKLCKTFLCPTWCLVQSNCGKYCPLVCPAWSPIYLPIHQLGDPRTHYVKGVLLGKASSGSTQGRQSPSLHGDQTDKHNKQKQVSCLQIRIHTRKETDFIP